MSGIRGKNTKPEIVLRKLLHRQGFRFSLHARLPGKPDLVFAKWNAAVFIHGCFWHRHECRIFKWPTSRSEFWRAKLEGNARRDERNLAALAEEGWRTGVVWECSLRDEPEKVAVACARWLRSKTKTFER